MACSPLEQFAIIPLISIFHLRAELAPTTRWCKHFVGVLDDNPTPVYFDAVESGKCSVQDRFTNLEDGRSFGRETNMRTDLLK